jgi:hypothetical protein
MNIICDHKYNQFKNVLSGCRTILDAYYFAEIYSKRYPDMKNIVYSMIHGKRYDSVLDFRTMKNVMAELNEQVYKEDALIMAENIINKISDPIQINTLTRIANSKASKPFVQQEQPPKFTQFVSKLDIMKKYDGLQHIKLKLDMFSDMYDIVTKKCPHCQHDCNAKQNSTYVVCGYSDENVGYDWEGCGKDWCFQCEKILCKTWDQDKLYLESNRVHNTSCCVTHAHTHGKNYPNDYCQCTTKHVSR